jgi:hypothetical protein
LTTIFTTSATTLYSINASVHCTGVTASATAILIIKYTDPSGTVQTITLPTATCTILGSLSLATVIQKITIQTGTNIQYNVTAVLSPNYQARVAIFQEGIN